MRELVEKIESIIDDDSLHDAMEIAHGLNWVRHELEPELKNPQARYYVGEAEYYLEGLVDDYIALKQWVKLLIEETRK